MDEYDPNTVFSSIDHQGRYAFGNQPAIAQWNLTRLAETLLPLIDPEPNKAVELAIAVLEPFMAQFDAAFLAGMRRKIGLSSVLDGDTDLIKRLLTAMQQSHADFTNTFRRLAFHIRPDGKPLPSEPFKDNVELDSWLRAWRQRLSEDPQPAAERAAAMCEVNPAFIPRNHRVQAALDAAETGDQGPFRALIEVLQRPYDEQPQRSEYAQPPSPAERVVRTFCGT